MKFEVSLQTLLSAMQIVSRLVPIKPPIHALSGVLLTPDQDQIVLSASDQASAVKCVLKAKVESEAGEYALVPAKEMLELLRRIKSGEILINIDSSNTAHIRSGSSRHRLSCLDPGDFPDYPEAEVKRSYALEAETLRSLIRKTTFCASTDDAQPAFNGVTLEISDAQDEAKATLDLSATDGTRVAIAWTRYRTGDDRESKIKALIHSKTIGEIGRMLGVSLESEQTDAPSMVTIGVGESKAVFEWNRVKLVTNLMKAESPDLKAVVPSSYIAGALVRVSEISHACDVASLFSKTFSGVYVRFSPDKLIVESAFPGVGHSVQEVPAIVVGEPVDAAFNGRLLLQGLDAMDTEWVWFKIASEEGPGVIAPAVNPSDSEGASFSESSVLKSQLAVTETEEGNLYVVLPLRIE